MPFENKDTSILINCVKVPMISAGLWTRPLTKNPFLEKLIFLYSIFARLNYGLFYIGLLGELARLIVHKYELQIIIASFSVCVNATKIATKVIIYLKNDVLKMCDDIIEREEEIWRQNDKEVIKLYIQKVKTGQLFRTLLAVSTFSTILGLNITGAYANLQLIKYNEANNVSLESHYMFQFWFPGNKLDHLNWVNTIGFVFSYAGLTYNVTSHMVLITLIFYGATHLRLLQHHLKNYIPGDFKEDQMDETVSKLKGYILEHQYLINFAEKINKSCKNVIMLEFILSSLDVASVTITILKLKAFTEFIWLGFFFCVLVIQIFCLAWSCNEINLESQAVADAAFESKWHLLNKDGKQVTHTLILRAQRPLTMTIGPFGPMTTQSFLMVMKGAYSYLSIMRQE